MARWPARIPRLAARWLARIPRFAVLTGLASGVALALAIGLLISTHNLATDSRAAILQIYDLRVSNCAEQNARHDRTLTVLRNLYSRGHASQHSEQATELVINALVPVRDCSAIRRFQPAG